MFNLDFFLPSEGKILFYHFLTVPTYSLSLYPIGNQPISFTFEIFSDSIYLKTKFQAFSLFFSIYFYVESSLDLL